MLISRASLSYHPKRQHLAARRVWAVAVLVACSVVTLWQHDVSTVVTEADAKAIRAIVGTLPTRNGTLDRDVFIVRAVQHAVLSAAPRDIGIPLGQSREPADLLAARAGLCYDRSRTIEKALRLAGFDVRHVFMWRAGDGSHAVSEALTADGWLVVDSNEPWVSLVAGRPVALGEFAEAGIDPPHGSYGGFAIAGLYSKHGQFYPPFTPIPDVSWRELLASGW